MIKLVSIEAIKRAKIETAKQIFKKIKKLKTWDCPFAYKYKDCKLVEDIEKLEEKYIADGQEKTKSGGH